MDMFFGKRSNTGESRIDARCAGLTTFVGFDFDPSVSAYKRGRLHLSRREFPQAVEQFTLALANDPKSVLAHLYRAVAYKVLNRSDDTWRALERTLALTPINAETYLERAQVRDILFDDLEGAIEDANKGLERFANSDRLLTLRADFYQKKKLIDLAMQDLNAAIRLKPDDGTAWGLRAEIYLSLRKLDECIADATVALGHSLSTKNKMSARITRSSAYANAKRFDEAMIDINRALVEAPGTFAVLIARATYFTMQDKDEEALIDLNDVLTRKPTHAQALLLRGQIYFRQGLYDLAWQDFSAVIREEPTRSAGYAKRAAISYVNGDLKAARSDVDKAIELDPHEKGALYLRANLYVKDNLFDIALEDLNVLLKLDPNRIEALQLRAAVYCDQGKYHDAVSEADHVIELSPDLAASHSIRGMANVALGAFDAALHDYDHAIHLKPADSNLFFDRGSVYLKAGKLSAAEADLTRAIQYAESKPFAYDYAGCLYSERGEHLKAIEYYDEALAIQPDATGILNNKAWSLLQLGRIEEARPIVEQALILQSSLASALHTRGKLYETLGDSEKAIADYRLALEGDSPQGVKTEMRDYIAKHSGEATNQTDLPPDTPPVT